MHKRLPVLLALFILTSCEYIPFPSGALQGQNTPLPDSWAEVSARDIIQLETNPAEPYSVNLWVVEMDGDLFVHAGDNRPRWIEDIEVSAHVRLGSEQKIYALKAQRVTDQPTFDRLAEVWKTKYGSYPGNMNVDEAYVIRLTRPL